MKLFFVLCSFEHEICNLHKYEMYDCDKFHDHLSWSWKNYDFRPRSMVISELCSLFGTVHEALALIPTYKQYNNKQYSAKLKVLPEAQWLSGRELDSRSRGFGFGPHRRHCIVSLSKTH